jgi:hypothetical protein
MGRHAGGPGQPIGTYYDPDSPSPYVCEAAGTDYTLNVNPDAHWPGMGASKVERHDADQVTAIAAWLHERVQSITGPAKALPQETAAAFGPDTWFEAKNLKDASTMVSQAVTLFVGQTVANLSDAAKALRTAHSNYAETEHANSAVARSADAALGGSPAPAADAHAAGGAGSGGAW